LRLLGVFHPKTGRNDPMDAAQVQRAVRARQLTFPIAILGVAELKSWWLTGPSRPATPVTFLLDKKGIIRFVHPGMEYHDSNGSEERRVRERHGGYPCCYRPAHRRLALPPTHGQPR
jgi:hypothetical protein